MANKYLSASLGTRNWNDTTGTWVTSNGGTTPTTAPTTSDIAYCTSLSGNVTCTTATDTTGTLYCTGYTGTITINASCNLTVVANLTFSATMTLVNSGTLTYMTVSTVNALLISGIDIPGTVSLGVSGNKIWEIGSNITFLGAVTFAGQNRMNSYLGPWNVYFKTNVTANGNVVAGTCSIYFQGGTIDGRFGTTNVYLDGNVTTRAQFSNIFNYVGFGGYANTCTVTWLSGTFTNNNTFITITGTTSFDTGSDVSFYRFRFAETNSHTITLLDDLYIQDILLEGNQGALYSIDGAYSIKCSGSIYSYSTNTFYSSVLTGTATLEMVGTGTLGIARNFAGSSSSKPITYVGMNISINTAGTMTFGNIGLSENKTLTYTTGTIAATGTINIVGVYTLSADLTYPNLVIGEQDKGTSIASYDPYVLNITTDATIDNLTINPNSELYITDTKTIDITTSFTTRGVYFVNVLISSTGTGYINYTGTTLGNASIVRTDFTNISSTSQLITFKGVVTTSNNIYSVDFEDISSPKITILEV